MADGTTIEWCRGADGRKGATWNVITGCTVLSPGCTNCYAMKLAGTRLRNHWSRQGLTQPSKAGPVWTGEVRFNARWLDQPLAWRRPRMIFVAAHGDLFHHALADRVIDSVFAVMAMAPQHTFQCLTKRAGRMRAYCSSPDVTHRIARAIDAITVELEHDPLENWRPIPDFTDYDAIPWPLPNVWLGVSAEDQIRANERIPHLLTTPAAVRFASLEPLLGPIDLNSLVYDDGERIVSALTGQMGWRDGPDGGWEPAGVGAKLAQVIVGGESGPRARPMHPDWARQPRDDCAAAGVAFFHKQNGEFASVSEVEGPGEHFQFPDGATVRRVGKHHAGRLLDGVEHNGMPAEASA